MKTTPANANVPSAETTDASPASAAQTSAPSPSSVSTAPQDSFVGAAPFERSPGMPRPRGTEPLPPMPSIASATDTPGAFDALVEQADQWAEDLLSRREVAEETIALFQDQLEGLTLSLADIQRQLKRPEGRGLNVQQSIHLFYLAIALDHEPLSGAAAEAIEDMQDVAFQIRTALMRSAESTGDW